ncbi:MAG: hypothetical protein WKF71_15630 [Pyrinomonadaceae bacterium]
MRRSALSNRSKPCQKFLRRSPGEVVEVNDALNDTPEAVNSDPYGDAWMIKIKMKNKGEADAMLNAAEYEEYLQASA